MSSRLVLYGAISTLGAASVIGSALHTRANFYAAAVAVGRSSGALMVLANFALFNTICFGIAVKAIFFGRLRSIEYEHLFERLWLFLTESLLALTIFRDDFSAPFAVMYGVLLFLKCFHWITADRVDYMDQIPPPGPPTIFHVRVSLIISLLTIIDIALVIYSLESIVVDGVSAMVLFASEFMILLASISGTSARYGVGLIDLRRARGREDAPSWEEKSMYLFYVDLAVDFVKLLTYLTFFLVILLNYGLPLHILRDVYMTLRSFLSRCSDLIRYRRATKDMDSLYPNATSEDLTRNGDRTCIICREEMVPHLSPAERAAAAQAAQAAGTAVPAQPDAGGPNETPKKLQCGHIFHFHCLRSWLERQQSCPTWYVRPFAKADVSRRDVLRTPAPTRPGPRLANGVNVQINPPAPAPGALPRANAPPGAPNPIQAVYDQYFRPPQPAPTRAPAPAATPAPSISTESQAQTSRDQSIQSGIWGGPIAPGRFFSTPLGAAPNWPPSASTRQHIPIPVPIPLSRPIRSQGAHMPVIRLPEPGESASGGSSNTATPPGSRDEVRSRHPPPPLENVGGETGVVSMPVSGANTPFTSNPPQIFDQPESGVAGAAEEDEGVKEEEVGDARKAAAEAALRRMGLRSATRAGSGAIPRMSSMTSLSSNTSATSPLVPQAEQSTIPPPRFDPISTTDRKGNSKARPIDPLSEEPTTTPYLTLPGSDLVGFSSSLSERLTATQPRLGAGIWGENIDRTREALEDRLRLLREVDEVVWGLVGELSRVKSGWESRDGEDGTGGRDDGTGREGREG